MKHLLSFSSLKCLEKYLTVSPGICPLDVFPLGRVCFGTGEGGALKAESGTESGWTGQEVCGAGSSPSWSKAEAEQ